MQKSEGDHIDPVDFIDFIDELRFWSREDIGALHRMEAVLNPPEVGVFSACSGDYGSFCRLLCAAGSGLRNFFSCALALTRGKMPAIRLAIHLRFTPDYSTKALQPPPTTDYRLPITDYRLPITDYPRLSANFRLRLSATLWHVGGVILSWILR